MLGGDGAVLKSIFRRNATSYFYAAAAIVVGCAAATIVHSQEVFTSCSKYAGQSDQSWDCITRSWFEAFRRLECVTQSPACLALEDDALRIACKGYLSDPRSFHRCKERYGDHKYRWLSRDAEKYIQRNRDAAAAKAADLKAQFRLPAWTTDSLPRLCNDCLLPSGLGLEINLVTADRAIKKSATEINDDVAHAVYRIEAGATAGAISYGRAATGSAVAVSPSTALTNCHVVEGRPFIQLKDVTGVSSTVSYPIRVKTVAADLKSDRCVISVIDSKDSLAHIGDLRLASDLRVGERVYAIGYPKGLPRTIADGIISSIHDRGEITIIQTTAPISPGSSGGALIDERGALVGITTFLVKDGQNLNFAIAADAFWR